jgi:hypothetical protein
LLKIYDIPPSTIPSRAAYTVDSVGLGRLKIIMRPIIKAPIIDPKTIPAPDDGLLLVIFHDNAAKASNTANRNDVFCNEPLTVIVPLDLTFSRTRSILAFENTGFDEAMHVLLIITPIV